MPGKKPRVPERAETPRSAIRDALLGAPLSARQISQRASVPEKEVAAHLEHLGRSLKRQGERLVIKPAECLACGFVFKERQRMTAPGSCPSCRSERIAPPTFQIVGGAASKEKEKPRREGEDLSIRPIRPEDDAAVASIIRTVMPEFGARGPGFAINDAEVDTMFAAYSRPGAAYFVVEREGRVVGGGGVAPLEGGDAATCELRKMYFLPEARGFGMGKRLLDHCLKVAAELGYSTCYLETLTGMDAAQHLYDKAGFHKLEKAMGCTGHHGCDRFYAMSLSGRSGAEEAQ
jgi:putative acetyltransferase